MATLNAALVLDVAQELIAHLVDAALGLAECEPHQLGTSAPALDGALAHVHHPRVPVGPFPPTGMRV